MASKNKTTIPTRTQDTIAQQELVGVQTDWPKGEKIPRSLEEAVKSGWKITCMEGNTYDMAVAAGGNDDESEFGEATMQKTVDGHRLYLKIPYWAAYTYGKPHTPKAHAFRLTPWPSRGLNGEVRA